MISSRSAASLLRARSTIRASPIQQAPVAFTSPRRRQPPQRGFCSARPRRHNRLPAQPQVKCGRAITRPFRGRSSSVLEPSACTPRAPKILSAVCAQKTAAQTVATCSVIRANRQRHGPFGSAPHKVARSPVRRLSSGCGSSRRQGPINGPSVEEVAGTGEVERDARGIRGFDDLVVTN